MTKNKPPDACWTSGGLIFMVSWAYSYHTMRIFALIPERRRLRPGMV